MTLQVGSPKVSIIFRDITNRERSSRLEANPAHPDVANLGAIIAAPGVTNLQAVANLYAAVTLHAIAGFRVSVDILDDVVVAGNGSILDQAAVSVNLATPGKHHTLYIPAPEPTIFVGDGAPGGDAETIDGGDAALLAWIALFQDAVVDDDVNPEGVFLVSDGEQVSSVPAPKGKKVK